MASPTHETIISVMLAVPDTPKAVAWYKKALGAGLLWSLGSVAGLEIDGAPFFLHQPVKDSFDSPKAIGTTTARVEVFVDEPDELIARAVEAGATGGDIENLDSSRLCTGLGHGIRAPSCSALSAIGPQRTPKLRQTPFSTDEA